jgi:uncharacterized membrane protein YfcA
MPMTTIAPLITLLGLTASVRQAFRGWREIAWKAVLRFVPGTFIGVPLGLWAVKNVDQELLIRLLGAYVVAYALWSLFGERLLGRALTMPDWVVHPLGIGGALIATLFGGLAGPLYVTYFDSLGLAKGVFRVTVSTTLLTLSVVRSIGYLAAACSAPRTSCSSGLRSCRRASGHSSANGCMIALRPRCFAAVSACCSRFPARRSFR